MSVFWALAKELEVNVCNYLFFLDSGMVYVVFALRFQSIHLLFKFLCLQTIAEGASQVRQDFIPGRIDVQKK